ncbi:MAG: hypothetical protein FWE20_12390 [Defluviitaleaceae bacterium]|nr:hypothetical protein [Defluviitaleaceae bacterium]
MAVDHAQRLGELIHKHIVMNLASIKASFPGRSRNSIVRDLKALHYLSSYNNAGGYYTLPGIPSFDSDGIWRHADAYFSKHGTLKSTAKRMVDSSENGLTHDELRTKLGVRVQNTLLDLATQGEISREKHGGAYIYVSADNELRLGQVGKRLAAKEARVDPYTTIAVLNAVIKHPGLNAQGICSILADGGSNIGLTQVATVFDAYDLEKKNSPCE